MRTVSRAPGSATLVVQKYGGTSVGDAERIRRVAERVVETAEAGDASASSSSAMGDTTDELLELAAAGRPQPARARARHAAHGGEQISIALLSMAIIDLGREAVSFTGSQAGHPHRHAHGRARIVDVRSDRVREALDAGQGRDRRRLPGRLDDARRDDARARRLGHDRRRARGRARRRRLRDLHGRRGRLHGRPAHRPGGAQARRGLVRGDARARGRGREGARMLRSVEYARNNGVALHVRSSFARRATGTWVDGGGRADGAGDHLGHRARHLRGEGDDPRGARPAGHRGGDLPAARRRGRQRRHDRPERLGGGPHRHLVHAAEGRSRRGRAGAATQIAADVGAAGVTTDATSRRSRSSARG